MCSFARSTDQDLVDLLLRREAPTRDLRDVDDLDTLAQPVQDRQRRQPVDDDDIGVRQRLKTLECQQSRIPRATTDQNHPAR